MVALQGFVMVCRQTLYGRGRRQIVRDSNCVNIMFMLWQHPSSTWCCSWFVTAKRKQSTAGSHKIVYVQIYIHSVCSGAANFIIIIFNVSRSQLYIPQHNERNNPIKSPAAIRRPLSSHELYKKIQNDNDYKMWRCGIKSLL